jgi:pimeloyl-ACP methyl ester carboxylesterase
MTAWPLSGRRLMRTGRRGAVATQTSQITAIVDSYDDIIRAMSSPPVVALRWGARALISNPRRRSTTALTFRQFNRAFTNTWPADAARAAYERYSAPADEQVIIDRMLGRLPWRRASAFTYSYDDRAPLLIIAAEHDALVPPSVVARNCQRYYSSLAETDFASFPGRSHLAMLERGWQEIADYVSGWLMRRPALPSAI